MDTNWPHAFAVNSPVETVFNWHTCGSIVSSHAEIMSACCNFIWPIGKKSNSRLPLNAQGTLNMRNIRKIVCYAFSFGSAALLPALNGRVMTCSLGTRERKLRRHCLEVVLRREADAAHEVVKRESAGAYLERLVQPLPPRTRLMIVS